MNGNLAVSRAIGDATEKPFVSAEPDLTRTRVDPDGEAQDLFVILATE